LLTPPQVISLNKRIIVPEIGSPQTEMNENLDLLGANFHFTGYQTMSITLDSAPLITMSQVYFTDGTFQVQLGFVTTSATHELCVSVQGEQVCTQIVVCGSDCAPRIAFADSHNITAASREYFPRSQVLVVGNGFRATEEVTVTIDEGVNGQVLGERIEVQENGRFEATVTLPANETYGEHVISVIGSETIGHGPSQAFATLEIVQFMPEKR
jgi:hypothetical protein